MQRGGYEMTVANDLIALVIEEIKSLHNEVFLVHDLLNGYEWNRTYRNVRLLLGVLFLNYVNASDTYLIPI